MAEYKVVNMSEPILAEDSTFSELSPSLKWILNQMDETATHHDYFVALLLVLLAESGFDLCMEDSSKIEECNVRQRNKRLVHIPSNWKQPTNIYEIKFLYKNHMTSKLIAIPCGDAIIINMFSNITTDKNIYSMITYPLKYVNPYTQNIYMRYRNIKEISHNFKDTVVTPLRSDILLKLGSTGPGFQCLPVELQYMIASM